MEGQQLKEDGSKQKAKGKNVDFQEGIRLLEIESWFLRDGNECKTCKQARGGWLEEGDPENEDRH